MEWVNVKDKMPKDNIDVRVKTESGNVGIAKRWNLIGRWLTMDVTLSSGDIVIFWKYLGK